jgi:hypothetical protein
LVKLAAVLTTPAVLVQLTVLNPRAQKYPHSFVVMEAVLPTKLLA